MHVILLSGVVVNPTQYANHAVSYLLFPYVSASRPWILPIPICLFDLFVCWENREYFSICVVDI